MHFEAWLGISFTIFCGMLVGAFILNALAYKKKRILTPNKLLLAGAFLSAVVLLCPIYLENLFEVKGFFEYLKSIVISILHALRLFVFDDGYVDTFESGAIHNLSEPLHTLYSLFGASLYIFAPMLTLKFVLSFFKNAAAYRKYVFSFGKVTHVFSELNEKSLALAKSIDDTYNKNDGKYKFFRKALIVFNGVSAHEEKKSDLLEEAKEIGAVCFSKDLGSIKYARSKKCKRKLNFYLISEDEEAKIRHAEEIMHDYDYQSVELRVFSEDIRTELLLAARDTKEMKVIRVEEAQSLIYHTLDAYGMRLFRNARNTQDGDKLISAVVVGLGKFGIEMVKALTWFSQMDGYRLKIKAFDADEGARDRFANMCHELMSEKLNGRIIPGESRYEIDIVGGVDIQSAAFSEALSEITDATYVFVCTGSDVDNLNAAVKIRSLCERVVYVDSNRKPDIETVIYDSSIAELMGEKWQGEDSSCECGGVTNFKNEPYRIHMIGSLNELYSHDTMLNSALVKHAEGLNERYAQCVYEDALEGISGLSEPEFSQKKASIEKQREENLRAFYKYEYNYRSSLARIIHEKKSVELGSRNAECEHRRWNAYMRSEGYCFSGNDDAKTRNDLGKLHHNLVPFAGLREKVDIAKDN